MTREVMKALVAVTSLFLVAACGGAGPSGTVQPSGTLPSEPASVGPSPSTAPSEVPAVSPTLLPTPAPTLSPAESALVAQLRTDARVRCSPRRTELPTGATAGAECHPDDPLVDSVGVYGFPLEGGQPEPALTAYLERLDAVGVALGSGDCDAGVAGDRSWPANLPDEGESGTGPRATRAGCFLNDLGIANIRVTCYGEIYVGVLGNTKELALLNAWTWRVGEGESPDRDPPGICAAPD